MRICFNSSRAAILAASLFVLVASPSISPAQSQGYPVALINATGYTFNYVYSATAGTGAWSADLLGEIVLNDGEMVYLDSPDGCVIDVMAVDEGEDVYFKWGVDICENDTVTFELSDLYTGEEPVYASIHNDTGYDVHFIFVAPSESAEWGEDLLGDMILSNGDEFVISVSADVCFYDIRLVDLESDSYTRGDVNLCMYPYQSFTIEDIDQED